MIYLILGISLTLNVVMIIGIFLYLKVKVLGINKMKKELESKFISDDDLDAMLKSL